LILLQRNQRLGIIRESLHPTVFFGTLLLNELLLFANNISRTVALNIFILLPEQSLAAAQEEDSIANQHNYLHHLWADLVNH
jgi:hypothetical protein